MKIIELFMEIKSGNEIKTSEILASNSFLINQYLYGVTPLLFSIECGQEKVALSLCRKFSADSGLRDNMNVTPLERAIEAKFYTIVEEIIIKSRTKDLDEFYIGTETILTKTLKSEDQNISIALIKGGIDVNKPNLKDEYPIELIIKFNKIQVLNSLLERADVNLNKLKNGYYPLVDACEKDLTDACIFLINAGANVNPMSLKEQKEKMWTPLMHAISNNNEVLVTKLVDKGADLYATDFNGNTVVHMAVLIDNQLILAFLLSRNAPKCFLNNDQMSPLDLAKLNQSEECIQLLI